MLKTQQFAHVAAAAVVLAVLCRQAAAQDLEVALANDLGFRPDSMAIANVQPAAATQVLLDLADGANGAQQEIAAQQAICDQASDLLSELGALQAQGLIDAETTAAYVAATAEFNAALAEIEIIRVNLFMLVTASIPESQREALLVMRSSAQYPVPPEFRVRDRTPRQWRAIQRALRAEARALRLGKELAPEPTELLASVRSDPLVVQAAANLQANLPLMELVFEQFAEQVGGHD